MSAPCICALLPCCCFVVGCRHEDVATRATERGTGLRGWSRTTSTRQEMDNMSWMDMSYTACVGRETSGTCAASMHISVPVAVAVAVHCVAVLLTVVIDMCDTGTDTMIRSRSASGSADCASDASHREERSTSIPDMTQTQQTHRHMARWGTQHVTRVRNSAASAMRCAPVSRAW